MKKMQVILNQKKMVKEKILMKRMRMMTMMMVEVRLRHLLRGREVKMIQMVMVERMMIDHQKDRVRGSSRTDGC